MLALELGDFFDKLISQLQLILASLNIRSAQALHVFLIEDGLHRFDFLKRLF